MHRLRGRRRCRVGWSLDPRLRGDDDVECGDDDVECGDDDVECGDDDVEQCNDLHDGQEVEGVLLTSRFRRDDERIGQRDSGEPCGRDLKSAVEMDREMSEFQPPFGLSLSKPRSSSCTILPEEGRPPSAARLRRPLRTGFDKATMSFANPQLHPDRLQREGGRRTSRPRSERGVSVRAERDWNHRSPAEVGLSSLQTTQSPSTSSGRTGLCESNAVLRAR